MRRRFGLVVWRLRHVIAATCVGLAVVLGLAEVRPEPPATERVVVLAGRARAGSTLAAGDVAVRDIPAGFAPDGVFRHPDQAAGARLAVGLPAGFPLTEAVLVGPGLAETAPLGTVVVPIRLADAGVARLLRAGDRIDVLQASADGGGGAAVVLARGALVLARADEDGGGSFFADSASEAPLLLIAVPPVVATLVSGAGTWSPLSAVLVAGA